MTILQVCFYIFSSIALMSAAMVVISKNPVRCALFLILTFLSTASIWLLAEAEFLALVLVLVYVGAVMTLFLFVIMMLNVDTTQLKRQFIKYALSGVVLVGVFLTLVWYSLQTKVIDELAHAKVVPQTMSNIEALGRLLYTDYALPFEIAGVILLIAIISSISLVHRGPQNCKTQSPVSQMQVKAKDRLKIIKMDSN